MSDLTLKKQRAVNEKLGKNIIKDHNKIYDEIQKRIGETKKCKFGHTKGSKTGVKHEGCEDVPIRNFELREAYISENKVIIERGDGLQGFCRICSQQRRRARMTLNNEQETWSIKEEEVSNKTSKESPHKERINSSE